MTFHNAHLIAHSFVGLGPHTALVPPAPPAILPHLSASTLLGMTINSKFSPTELGPFGIPLVARGNDSGYFVSHLAIPPVSVLVPVIIALAFSKVMFGSSKVHINVKGNPEHCGCSVIPFAPVSFNLACNDPCPMPTDFVVCPNTIEVSMNWGDFLGGLFSCFIEVLLGYGLGKLGGNLSKRAVSGLANRSARRLLERVIQRDGISFITHEGFEHLFKTGAMVRFIQDQGERVAAFGGGKALDAIVGLVSGGSVDSAASLGDTSAQGYGANPASDPRIFSTDGPGVSVGGW